MHALTTFLAHPLAILAVGIVAVVGMIIVLRLNAFIALLAAALLVSVLAPGAPALKATRVAEAFGTTCGKIGIVIAMAAVIGRAMMDSGAADRIVRSLLRALGERRAPEALLSASFVLAVPVFFDTVFYLMVPLARSLWRRTRHNYTLYLLMVATGGVITHVLVPPTPGPLAMAENLRVHLGVMILVGALIGLPAAAVGLMVARVINRLMPLEMRPYAGESETTIAPDAHLPSLAVSLAPILLPVALISADTVFSALAKAQAAAPGAKTGVTAGQDGGAGDPVLPVAPSGIQRAAAVTALVGNPNLALLLAAVVAMSVLKRQRRLSLGQLAETVENALMSGGVIILITAAGGAFGAMLKEAGVGDVVKASFEGHWQAGLLMLVAGFVVAALMKTAQGSSTVAMVTTTAMLAAMGATRDMLGFHPVYLATAVAGGSLVGSWMNDSGFWVFARMGVLTETEALRSWTILLAIIGGSIFLFSLLGASVLPLGALG